MTKIDFSYPQRMSPAAFFIIFTKLFRRFLGPVGTLAIVNLISAYSRDTEHLLIFILITIAACFGLPLIYTIIYYFTRKYYVKDGNLVFLSGLLNRETTIVPLDRIHSLRTQKGLWYRIFDMRGIVFDTLATRKEEIELILDEYDWKRLLAAIEQEDQVENPTQLSSNPQEIPQSHASTIHYPTKNLLLAALCQNHLKGMAVLGSFLAVIFGNLNDLPEETTNTVAFYLDEYFEKLLASPLMIVSYLAIVYILILILWLGRVLLRYFDTTLKYDSKLLTFSYGLLNRASCRFFHDKICTIWIKRNLLEKKFGFCTLMLRQALNVSAKKEDDNMRLYGTDSSSFYLKWWLGDDYADSPGVMEAKSGKGLLYRYVAIISLLCIAVAIPLILSEEYIWLIAPFLYLLYSIVKGFYKMRQSKITLKEDYLVIHNGAFAEMANYIKYSNVEVVRLRRSPFTRFSHRVSLAISTSGTTFTVRSLPESQAQSIYNHLLQQSDLA